MSPFNGVAGVRGAHEALHRTEAAGRDATAGISRTWPRFGDGKPGARGVCSQDPRRRCRPGRPGGWRLAAPVERSKQRRHPVPAAGANTPGMGDVAERGGRDAAGAA